MGLRAGIEVSVLQRNDHHHARRVTDGARRMALAGQVFGEDSLARPEAIQRSVAESDLDDARRLELCLIGVLTGRERQLDFFEMRLLIGSSVQTKESHVLAVGSSFQS